MKKLISILAGVVLAVNAFATGNEGVNPPQSGVLIGTATSQILTNQFAFPFQTAPVVTIYPGSTNGTPVTNSFVTTTNFAISFAPAGTNTAWAWTAAVGATKLQYGTSTNALASSTSVVFPVAYASAPVVVLTGNTTNAFVATVSTTNFTILGQAVQTNGWISIGTVANPQSEYTGMFPVNNKVLAP